MLSPLPWPFNVDTMTDTAFTPQDVADYLSSHPQFFMDHPDVFSGLRVPNPHGGQAISLSERQILTLRERTKELEWQLSALAHNARSNETIADSLTSWTERLLGEVHPELIPGAIAMGLAETFDLDAVALRVWGLPALPATGYGEPVSEDIRTFADSLKVPFCGRDTAFDAASWLSEKPASLALIALRLAPEADSIGLLVLGSKDPERFGPEKGVAFLTTIARLAQAALARLRTSAVPVTPEVAG